ADVEDERPGDAERRLRRVLARAPGEVEARYQLARLLARAGRDDEANAEQRLFDRDSQSLAAVQSRLAASPGGVRAAAEVADGYRALGLLHLAEVHYLHLLARDPRDQRIRAAVEELRQQAASTWGDQDSGGT